MSTFRILAYTKSEDSYFCLKTEGELPWFKLEEAHINPFFATCRVLVSLLNLRTESENYWEHLEYFYDPPVRECLKHIAYHSFYCGNTICVPLPEMEFSDKIVEDLDWELLKTRMAQAEQVNCFKAGLKGEATFYTPFEYHENPDFLIFHMQDYEPWSGLGEALYGGFIVKAQEKVNHYNVPRGQIPSPDLFSNAKGVVITGAKYCSFDDSLPWLHPFIELITTVYNQYPRVKFFGICLGHQILARAFGGKTGKNPCKTFIYKTESYERVHEYLEFPEKVSISMCHGDCVLELPRGATRIYTSPTCVNEAYIYQNRLLGFQGHPEFTSYLVLHFHSKVIHGKGTISTEAYESVLDQCVRNKTHSIQLFEVVNSFLRSN